MKISDLPKMEVGELADQDLLYVVDTSATPDVQSRSVRIDVLGAYLLAPLLRLMTCLSSSAEEEELLRDAILGRRGMAAVYADWLDDKGQHEKADRIRRMFG